MTRRRSRGAVVGDGSVRLAEQQLVGNYRHVGDETDPDVARYVLPVRWLKTVDRGDSVTAKGVVARRHPMCRRATQPRSRS
ncbi:hypothetical protein OG948_37365 (plasmid) [Embleya sp. NBC_00888]|uniref:hypothetical protein n=1 Tax=Embleya sp. NBC_00888 TaxID=2975960 RepID=UPI002F90D266|nr:hypothetical protein OG948_37365 [Embleya sp. NBC_00888]